MMFVHDKGRSSSERFEVEDFERYLEFAIDSPWYGSTEEGFGARLATNLEPGEVARLRDALSDWLQRRGHESAAT